MKKKTSIIKMLTQSSCIYSSTFFLMFVMFIEQK